jgi:hypothetical protein
LKGLREIFALMTIGGKTAASSGMTSADHHGARRIFSIKLSTDLGVRQRGCWTHLTITPRAESAS